MRRPFRSVFTALCAPLDGAANTIVTSGYATWFTAGGAIRMAHYDVIDDVITRKL